MPSSLPRLPAAFRRLAFSNLAAQSSEQLALATAPLAAVLLFDAGPMQTGYLQMAQTAPFLLLSMVAGVVADRISRRGLMVAAECVRALSLLTTMVLLACGFLNFALLVSLGVLGAVGTVAYSVAAPALVPALVAGGQLDLANRALELARSVAYITGPALGGLLVGYLGAPLAYAVAAALSLSAVAFLVRIPEPAIGIRIRSAVLRDMREGATFVLTHVLLRPVVVTAILFNTAWFVLQAVYVAYAVSVLHLTASGVGLTLGTYGAGMLVGALLAGRLAERLAFGTLIAIGPMAGLAGSLLMLTTLACPSWVIASLSFFLFGAGPILWTMTTTTLRQLVTPVAMLGRASAVVMTATFGARPAGACLGALLASHFGMAACLWASTIGFLVQFLVLFGSPVRTLDRQPERVSI